MENWFGLQRGQVFGQPPTYVDLAKRPGSTPVPKASLLGFLRAAPFVLVTSPNFVWSLIALAMYGLAPYDLTVASPWSLSFLTNRLALWLPVTLGYAGFWHVALYSLGWGSRPFAEGRTYNWKKVAHNLFWTTSGIAIWCLFENIMCYLWSSGRLAYVSDADSFGSLGGLLGFSVALAAIPVWRSVHFYFAHRFLHFGPLYQQVHSLHHRNTDTEPFSGLCMHPVEHLYYYACVLPSLLFVCTPFAFLWNGVHLLLSPAASHSGYEDHFQSDVFHYMHHRYFECNYAGTDASFLDVWFGTFKESMAAEDTVTAREDAKSDLTVAPTREFVTYLAGSALCCVPWTLAVATGSSAYAFPTAALVGCGPVALAVLLSKKSATGLTLFALYFHVLAGLLFCSFPITYACWLTLQYAASNGC